MSYRPIALAALLSAATFATLAVSAVYASSPTPSVAPTTLDGWRALEAKFAPSTLRDEITLTRLQLEYYDAPTGPESDAALLALVDWLRDRPEPQRAVLTEALRSNRVLFLQTPLKEKNAILCNKLTSDVDVD